MAYGIVMASSWHRYDSCFLIRLAHVAGGATHAPNSLQRLCYQMSGILATRYTCDTWISKGLDACLLLRI